jgi:hypothetical protein
VRRAAIPRQPAGAHDHHDDQPNESLDGVPQPAKQVP